MKLKEKKNKLIRLNKRREKVPESYEKLIVTNIVQCSGSNVTELRKG